MKKAIWTMIITLLLLLPVFPVTAMAEEPTGVIPVVLEYENFSKALEIETDKIINVTVAKYDAEGSKEFDTFDNYFKIVLPEDGYISGTFYEGDIVDPGDLGELIPLDHNIIVYNEQEEELVKLDHWNFGLPKGTYYIKGTFIYNVPGNFMINYTPADNWEKERAFDFAQATDIPKSMHMNGWVENSDPEYFKFTLPEPGLVSIGLDYTKGSEEQVKTWSVDLFGLVNDEYKMLDGSSGSTIEIDRIGLDAGTYYISVELFAENSSDNYYELFWDYTPRQNCETEWNDEYEFADVLPLNQAVFMEATSVVTVHGNRSVDHDIFTFSLDEPGPVSISVTPEMAGTFSFDIQDKNKDLIRSFELSCEAGDAASTWKLGLPAGSFYLVPTVTENIPLEFTLHYEAAENWEKELNDTPESATPIAAVKTGTTINGWHEDADDCYSFTLTEPGYINAALSYEFHEDELNQGRVFVLSLLDPTKEDMAVRTGDCHEDAGTNTGVSINKIGLDPGTYYLKVWSNWSEEAADNYYQLGLDFVPDQYCETEYNNDFQSADTVVLDKDYSAQTMNFQKKDYFKFEIPDDGIVTIDTAAEAACEIDLALCTDTEEQITYWTQGSSEGSSTNTSDQIELTKGSYYLITSAWEMVPYTFRVKFETKPAEHVHQQLQSFEAHDATCAEPGNTAYWYCSECGKYFSDAEGTSEIAENSWVVPLATGAHSYGEWTTIKEPTVTSEGSKERICTVCGHKETAVIDKLPPEETDDEENPAPAPAKVSIANAAAAVEAQTYTGKALNPALTVKLGTKTLRLNTDYTASYTNNINAGTAKVVIRGTGTYEGVKETTFTIKKAANPLKLKVSGKTTYKRTALKKAKKVTIKTVAGQGKVTYTLNKKANKAKIKVTSKGKVTIPKKCKKGTYKITVKAAGNNNYNAGTKTITIKVK